MKTETDTDPRAAARFQSSVANEARYAFTALGYFTRVPVPKWVGFEPHYLQAAARWFPSIGVFVGGVSALIYVASAHFFAPSIAVLLSMVATLILTGAFHEDGLADCCDAFGGAYARDDVLRIMHDSRIGAFGAIGLVMALVLKWQALSALGMSSTWRVAGLMVVAHAASRAMAITYVLTLDYVRSEGKAKPVVQRLGAGSVVWIALTGLPWLFWGDWRLGAVTLVVLVALRFVIGRWFVRRIGGYTGDCLGFAQQLFEIAIYLIALAWVAQ